jgi:hypothetical protein
LTGQLGIAVGRVARYNEKQKTGRALLVGWILDVLHPGRVTGVNGG